MKIEDAKARIVLNSKAEPTVEVCLKVEGAWVSASVPSGTSVSSKEVPPWPEGPDVNLSVKKAKKILEEEVFPRILRDVHPTEVDEILEGIDGTGNFSRIGGNTALAVSIAGFKAHAWSSGEPLIYSLSEIFGTKPSPVRLLENFVGGGKHGGSTDIQEFLVSIDTDDMEKSVHILSWMYREVKEMLKQRDASFTGALTIESAFVTGIGTEEILSLLRELSEFLSDTGASAVVGVDVAASSLWDGRRYVWSSENVVRTREEQIDYISELAREFSLFYIEDPLHEDDFEGFKELQRRVSAMVVGDDLFATNERRICDGVGGVIIKPNQCGTVTRAVRAVKKARKYDMCVIVSHRSGETEDTFASHFAVGIGADYFKAGAAGIRVVKLNEILRLCDLL